jgi:hypothetical protein
LLYASLSSSLAEPPEDVSWSNAACAVAATRRTRPVSVALQTEPGNEVSIKLLPGRVALDDIAGPQDVERPVNDVEELLVALGVLHEVVERGDVAVAQRRKGDLQLRGDQHHPVQTDLGRAAVPELLVQPRVQLPTKVSRHALVQLTSLG